ncbi:MAG: cell division protein ZapA [Erythrobacter sp.]
MSEVTLEIGGRPYTVACEEGQESHIEMLGSMIEDKLASMGQLAPSRSQNLLFAGLFLADDLHEAKRSNGGPGDALAAELVELRSGQAKADGAVQELQLERDALLSERDTMRADHETLKADLATAQAEREAASAKTSELTMQIEQLSAAQSDATAAPDLSPQLADLAGALEKCATKLEQRLSDA